jgi:hypothetical protein
VGAILDYGSLVQFQRRAAYVLAVELGAPHAGAHPFDNQVRSDLSRS